MVAWRVAESLLTLRRQIDAMAPARKKLSDGTIGDSAHKARGIKSDHNPNKDGVVTALDITNDPVHGVDAPALAELLRLSEDPRIKYVISNARIFSSKVSPWKWRPYDGINAHTKHFHVSVMDEKAKYDDPSPWKVDKTATISVQPASERCTDIVATVFGGTADPNRSAYDNHLISDDELGVALPSRISGRRPQVCVSNVNGGKSVVCGIVDVGPWNTEDAYWENGSRPQAEAGFDSTGRKTNLAGIDLTPAAAKALGINGKGKVDWEFVGAADEASPPTDNRLESLIADHIQELKQILLRQFRIDQTSPKEAGAAKMSDPLEEMLSALRKVVALRQDGNGKAEATPGSPTPSADDIQQLIRLLTTIFPTIKPALGQVNGALGDTIGNLLNGKKTAIGTIGALITSLLSVVPPTSALGGLLGAIPAALSGYGMPIFLAIAAWGVLGKLEKWAQGTAPRPRIPK